MKNKLKNLIKDWGIQQFWINCLSHFTFHHIEDCRHCPVFDKCHKVTLEEKDFDLLRACNHNICKFFMYKVYNLKIKED